MEEEKARAFKVLRKSSINAGSPLETQSHFTCPVPTWEPTPTVRAPLRCLPKLFAVWSLLHLSSLSLTAPHALLGPLVTHSFCLIISIKSSINLYGVKKGLLIFMSLTNLTLIKTNPKGLLQHYWREWGRFVVRVLSLESADAALVSPSS